MVNENPSHFFQPLLPGFQSHLNIPVKFFSEHIEGKHEGETVKLRSNASEKTWTVRMLGQRLTEGWKEFVEAHDLRVGDIVVFRHEGDMMFHVTALGPSCCEIEYKQSRECIHEDDVPFTQTVTASNLSADQLNVPIGFARRNRLSNGRLSLMNEEGSSWNSELKYSESESCRLRIVRGWTSFCTANKLEVGDSCTFKLLQNIEKPVFRLCSRKKEEIKKNIQSEDQIPFETVARTQKTGPKLKKREKTAAEGECSRLTRSRSRQ